MRQLGVAPLLHSAVRHTRPSLGHRKSREKFLKPAVIRVNYSGPASAAIHNHHMEHLTPKAAWALLQADPSATLLDIRMEIEALYVGGPPGAVHVPWYEYPDLSVNPERFAAQVKAEVRDLAAPLLLLCRSARRTIPAGAALEAAGYSRVVNILHGFEGDMDAHHHRSTINGWRFDGLPWVQS